MEDKKMQVVLLIAVVCSCAAGDEDGRPCQPTNNPNAFQNFERHHILPKNFQTKSKPKWQSHIQRLGRCGEPNQTFFERSYADLVIKICNGNGWNQENNLCTSNSKIPVYVVKVIKKKCRVKKTPRKTQQHVTVACDKVGGKCLPVHFEPKSQTNGRPRATCSSATDYWSDKQFNISIWID